jgi:GntR family transcriptional regulator
MTQSNHIQEIDRQTPIPLYFQIARILRKEIEDGIYRPGECIPTEVELQERFEVSRATIRQAIGDMVYQGLLERKRSKGTIVSATQLEIKLSDLASFTNEMMNSGFSLTTRVLELKYIPVPAGVADSLKLEPSELVASMERLRFVDQKPMAFEKWYASEKYVSGLDKSMFGESGFEQSTYFILMNKYGIEITRAIDTVSPMAVEGREAKLLAVKEGTPVLLRTRISLMADGIPVTYATGVYLIRVRFVMESNRFSR